MQITFPGPFRPCLTLDLVRLGGKSPGCATFGGEWAPARLAERINNLCLVSSSLRGTEHGSTTSRDWMLRKMKAPPNRKNLSDPTNPRNLHLEAKLIGTCRTRWVPFSADSDMRLRAAMAAGKEASHEGGATNQSILIWRCWKKQEPDKNK